MIDILDSNNAQCVGQQLIAGPGILLCMHTYLHRTSLEPPFQKKCRTLPMQLTVNKPHQLGGKMRAILNYTSVRENHIEKCCNLGSF